MKKSALTLLVLTLLLTLSAITASASSYYIEEYDTVTDTEFTGLTTYKLNYQSYTNANSLSAPAVEVYSFVFKNGELVASNYDGNYNTCCASISDFESASSYVDAEWLVISNHYIKDDAIGNTIDSESSSSSEYYNAS